MSMLKLNKNSRYVQNYTLGGKKRRLGRGCDAFAPRGGARRERGGGFSR